MNFDLNTVVRENVKKLEPYSSARDEYVSDGSKMVFLDANENPFENGVNRYPDPQQRTLKSILAEQNGVTGANLLLGNGSDEVLDLLFRAFCEPNQDNVITVPPTYGMYKVLSGINAIENKEVLLTNEFQLNTQGILDAVTAKSKIIFICSPNNPTGNSIAEKAILTLLENFNGLVVIDEAYIDFSTKPSWVTQLDQYPNLIITKTLSKAYGMAGIRLGICIASKEIIAVLNKIKPPYNINELTQSHALKRVGSRDRIQSEIKEILHQKDILMQMLPKIDFIKFIYLSDANFILAKVDDADKRYAQLLEQRVVVRNRSKQPLCENTLRFTIGKPDENIRLVRALKNCID